jgi:hypothetical protein
VGLGRSGSSVFGVAVAAGLGAAELLGAGSVDGVVLGRSGSSPGGVTVVEGEGTTVDVGVGVAIEGLSDRSIPLAAIMATPKMAMQNIKVSRSLEDIKAPGLHRICRGQLHHRMREDITRELDIVSATRLHGR